MLTPLSASDAATYGVEGYVCDLTWSDRRTMVEYRGELVHKQRATKLSDARKGNILNHLGYEVLILEKCSFAGTSSGVGSSRDGVVLTTHVCLGERGLPHSDPHSLG